MLLAKSSAFCAPYERASDRTLIAHPCDSSRGAHFTSAAQRVMRNASRLLACRLPSRQNAAARPPRLSIRCLPPVALSAMARSSGTRVQKKKKKKVRARHARSADEILGRVKIILERGRLWQRYILRRYDCAHHATILMGRSEIYDSHRVPYISPENRMVELVEPSTAPLS